LSKCVTGIRFSRFKRNARLAPDENVHPTPLVSAKVRSRIGGAGASGVGRDGDVHGRRIGVGNTIESLGRDADDRRRHVPDVQRLAANVSPAELRLPERVRQHGDVGAARRHVFVAGEKAAERGARGEEVEKRSADGGHSPLARRFALADREILLIDSGKLRE